MIGFDATASHSLFLVQDYNSFLKSVYSHATDLLQKIDSCNKYDSNLAHLQQQSAKQSSSNTNADVEKIFKETTTARLDVLLDTYNNMHDRLIPTSDTLVHELEDDEPMLE